MYTSGLTIRFYLKGFKDAKTRLQDLNKKQTDAIFCQENDNLFKITHFTVYMRPTNRPAYFLFP